VVPRQSRPYIGCDFFIQGDFMTKEKFIIVNSEGKLLVFNDKNERYPSIFFPSVLFHGRNIEFDISNLLLQNNSRDSYELIEEIKRVDKRCKTVNGHLIFENVEKIKKYYVKYEDIEQEKIKEIVKISYERDLIPEFLTVEEILAVIENKELHIRYDRDLPKVLKKVKVYKRG